MCPVESLTSIANFERRGMQALVGFVRHDFLWSISNPNDLCSESFHHLLNERVFLRINVVSNAKRRGSLDLSRTVISKRTG